MSPLEMAVGVGAALLIGTLVYSVLRRSPRPGRGSPRPPEHPPDQVSEDHGHTRERARAMRSDSERIRRAIEQDGRMLDQLSDELYLQGSPDERERGVPPGERGERGEGESWR